MKIQKKKIDWITTWHRMSLPHKVQCITNKGLQSPVESASVSNTVHIRPNTRAVIPPSLEIILKSHPNIWITLQTIFQLS